MGHRRHGPLFSTERAYESDGHIRVDFGPDGPFLEEGVELDSIAARHVEENVRQLIELTAAIEKASGATARLLWSELGESPRKRLQRQWPGVANSSKRFTIERLRTLVLVAGVVLVVALGLFLARGRIRNPLSRLDLPGRLARDITADASGFTLDHAFGGHSRYRIHASKASRYTDNHAILRDVQIELFGEDGSRVDRIVGAEFDYDQKNGTAKASGPVEITLMRSGVAPAIASRKNPNAASAPAGKSKATSIASAAATAERGQIHVKTSGLNFDTKSGVATTNEHVDFSMVQGSGSSMGATHDSKQGYLVLDKLAGRAEHHARRRYGSDPRAACGV